MMVMRRAGVGGGECLGMGRLACLVHYLAVLLPFVMSKVAVVDSGVRRPPVFWNASNTMFHASNNDHVIDVNIGDTIDIICPHYTRPSTSQKPYEYYVVYMVNQTDYEACIINDTSQKVKVLNCSSPNLPTPKMYTLLILDFQPIQGVPDFKAGTSYYFISTSGGGEKEVNNQFRGACYTHRLKMILRVIPQNNSRPATTREPNTTPSGVPTPKTTRPTPSRPSPTTRPTPTTKRTGPPTSRPTEKPGGGDGLPGGNGDNVIHVGGGGGGDGGKNEGTITDSGCGPLRPSSFSSSVCLWGSLLLALLLSSGVLR